jgi:hypothetical protein
VDSVSPHPKKPTKLHVGINRNKKDKSGKEINERNDNVRKKKTGERN